MTRVPLKFAHPHRPFLRLALLAVVLLAGLCIAALARAETPLVTIAPSPLQIPVGQTARAEVQIHNVTNLYLAQVVLQFDPALLEIVSMDAGPLLQGGESLGDIDNVGGTALFSTNLVEPAPAVSGSGVFLVLTLKGKAAGAGIIRIEPLLMDADGNDIAYDVRDVSFGVGGAAPPPAATPAASPTPPAAPTQPRPPTASPAAQPTSAAQPSAAPTRPPAGQPSAAPTATTLAPAASAAPQTKATPSPKPTRRVVPVASPTPPQAGFVFGETPLPQWLFIALLAALVFLMAISTVIILAALVAWYRRASGS
jgi:hypothetical protein